MQVNAATLMPRMNPTNSAADGSNMINKEASFKAELDAAKERLDKSAKSVAMTDEQIDKRNKDIKDASVQMEALMLKMLYNDMWKTVPKDTLFGDDNSMDIYRDMYHEELTKQMAENGGIGLADFIYKQLSTSKV